MFQTAQETPADIRCEYLTTKQVSVEFGIPESTLRYYRHIGEGPASFRMGRKRVVYRRSEVERWIADQEEATKRGGAGIESGIA